MYEIYYVDCRYVYLEKGPISSLFIISHRNSSLIITQSTYTIKNGEFSAEPRTTAHTTSGISVAPSRALPKI